MRPDQAPDDFFLPNFCSVAALLPLILVAQLVVFASALLKMDGPGLPWEWLALVSLAVLWVVMLTAAVLCRARKWLARLPEVASGSLCLAVVIVLALAVTLAGQYLLVGWFGRPWLDGWQLLRNALVAAVFGAVALRYLYLASALRRREHAAMAAQVEALQARIRPHFLFNSMNIIASLIPVRPDDAERAVEDLAELFRAALGKAGALGSWAEERSLCEHYLHLEQLRLGERLQISWQVDDLPAQAPIPAISLQPLLENAVYHGIGQLPQGGTITICGALRDGRVQLEVANPCPDSPAPGGGSGHHLALDNLDQRLKMLFGPSAQLTASLRDGLFIARLDYPVEH